MMTDDILLQVNKPGRYLGCEWNVARKEFDRALIKFALCFPDLYEVGMSNLGVRIIYGILNSVADVACERVFCVAADMENVMRQKGLEMVSLESKRRLKEFDFVGFSLAHELNYTNVLNMLDLAKMPLQSGMRDNQYPLVIAGGPCALNPEPMHEFFDLFVIGEAEEAILEIIDIYRELKDDFRSGKMGKEEVLFRLSAVEGVYAPSLYEVKYGPGGQIEDFRPKIKGLPLRIKKRFVRDFDSAYFPVEWLLPYPQIIHDRITLEVMRGCPNACRFCQARSHYYPLRIRSVQKIFEQAKQAYKNTGYEEISLCGLSVSDYPHIDELSRILITHLRDKAVSVSLPSIKPKTMLGNIASLIASVKKTGLTFAPEAASQRLRERIGKSFDLEEFYNSLREAYRSGYQHVKLYFMIGFPGEQEADLSSISEFVRSVSGLRKDISGRPAHVNISVNTLIPKPHTPFQWLPMLDLAQIRDKQLYLKKILSGSRFKLTFHNPWMSAVEGVLSRGNRRLAQAVLNVYKRGARFEAWESDFKFGLWQDAFCELGLDFNMYLKQKKPDEFLPWDFLDVGIDRAYLEGEFQKAIDIT